MKTYIGVPTPYIKYYYTTNVHIYKLPPTFALNKHDDSLGLVPTTSSSPVGRITVEGGSQATGKSPT